MLLLAAATAREDLASELASRDIELTTVIAYDVVPRGLDDDDAARIAASDVVIAMAPIAIDALDSLLDEMRAGARRVPLVAIGPTTAARATELDWPVAATAVAREPDAVCAAVQDLLAS